MTVMPPSNGVHAVQDAGRYVKPLPFYTCKSSGLSIQVRRISPSAGGLLTQAIMKECKALPDGDERKYPEPPIDQTEVGPEPRTSDPNYLAAKKLWEEWAQQEATIRLIRMIAADYIVVDPAIVTEELDHLKRALKREGAELEPLGTKEGQYTDEEIDRIYYLTSCCLLSERDTVEFMNFVLGQSQPQEEQVAAYTATFPASRQ